MMQVKTPTRKFHYQSVTLPDPNQTLSPSQVQAFYAAQYPELNNSEVEGPEMKNGEHHYKFIRASGSKGASPKELLAKAEKKSTPPPPPTGGASALLYAVQSHIGKPIPLPSEAFGFWG